MGKTTNLKKELADAFELFLQCVLALANTSKNIAELKRLIQEERKTKSNCSSCLFGQIECDACIINETQCEKLLKAFYDIFEKEANVLFKTVDGINSINEVLNFTSDEEECFSSLLKDAVQSAPFKEE